MQVSTILSLFIFRMDHYRNVMAFQLMLAFLLASVASMHSSRSGSTLCDTVKTCRCVDTGHNGSHLNCSNAGLNTTEVCSICSRINNVHYLDLTANQLSEIPSKCFKGCRDLVVLSLAFNNINHLANNSFEGLSQLKSLNLDNNMLFKNEILHTSSVFQSLMTLKELQLRKNVDEVDGSRENVYLSGLAHNTLSKLESIYLDGLPRGKFGQNFKHLKSLERIDFSGKQSNCHIYALTNHSFENVPHVRYLNLSYCRISVIEAGTFKPLIRLKYLDLSYNMALGFVTLRNVSYGLQFTPVEILDYSKVYKTHGLTTQMNRCDIWFLRNTSLKEIRLNSNRLAIVEVNALYLLPSTLEVIFAEDNDLIYGPYALQIGCLSNLRRLELSCQSTNHYNVRLYNAELDVQEKRNDTSCGCEVSNLPPKQNCPFLQNKTLSPLDFTLPISLKVMNFRKANLQLDPVPQIRLNITIRNSIESIDFSSNKLYTFSDVFLTLDQLEHVNLSNNVCTNISRRFFTKAPNIKRLDISSNSLGPLLSNDLEGLIFKPVHHIEILDLSNNWIQFLPENVFLHLKGLQLLNLSLNHIDTINFAFDHMKNLSGLYVKQNKLQALPGKLLEQLGDLSKREKRNIAIDLSQNPLVLSCKHLEFLIWMMEHSESFVDIDTYQFLRDGENPICYAELCASFDDFRKNCQSYTLLIMFSVFFILIFIFIIIVGLVYRYRWRLRYLYYMAKARYKGYAPVHGFETNRAFQYDAFISYANENYQFVTGDLFQMLDEAGLSLCLHQKDFLPGNYIAENILQAIQKSRITVIILSNDFLESKWCMYEFNMARMESIYSRNSENILFVVKYEDFDITRVTPELQECLECDSYLQYPQDENERPYFWRMLIQALRIPNHSW